MAEPENIVVKGAAMHNLKHVDVSIPRNKLVILTGVSGSGKSSLAFDTIYAEGQRRYVESLSAYARQFLGQMEKPKVDYIGGLSPAISIEQKTVSKNPRSTVGTVTEVMDYLRVLYARVGTPHCPKCGRTVQGQSPRQIADQLASLPAGTRFQLLAPVATRRKGTHADLIEQAIKDGFVRARIDGEVVDLSTSLKLAKTKPHNLDIVVDRLKVPALDEENREDFEKRLIDSVETTLRTGNGVLIADMLNGEELLLSEQNACHYCGVSFPELSPQLFSFNSPIGMCHECNGLGTQLKVDTSLIVVDENVSILDGATRWYGNIRKKKTAWSNDQLRSIARHYEVDIEQAWKDYPQKFKEVVIYGSGDEKIKFIHEMKSENGQWSGEMNRPVSGIIKNCERLFRQTTSEGTRRFYSGFMSQQPCPACEGTRLCPEARAVTLGGTGITGVGSMAIGEALGWVQGLYDHLDEEQVLIGGEVLKEIRDRLQFMLNVGLHYLTLDRPAPTLSGGEGQRIRLASQLGCGLVGVLYILDEPSIGLHSRDNRSLLNTLLQLRDMGNTVLVVEHDAETMDASDWIVDLGPGAGVLGGEVIACGTPEQIKLNARSVTGQYLSGAKVITANEGRRRPLEKGQLSIIGARQNNLKNVAVHFPLGVLTCVTGVSGSGKSSLITETLHPALARAYHNAQERPGVHDRIEGLDRLDKVINITQEPIGRTPHSNPATYVKLFDEIRQVFANLPEAKTRGYKPDRFSFNLKGGRCEPCKGQGQKVIEMHFLADVWVTCKECGGKRFNRDTLDIKFKGKTIADVLDMDVQEALELFAHFPKISRQLQTLHDVGLDYVKLGQSATTLSGGEAQRVKLAKELSRPETGRTLYILDEPTTGLHFADVQRLLDVLHRLVDAGNTVIVIEHNLDVIKTADWIIDLGPEGGSGGGQIIAQGTPEDVAEVAESYTGQFLRDLQVTSLRGTIAATI
jgi:excinuclease ABC subunit A